jgi:CRP-like cAMP-binding protein
MFSAVPKRSLKYLAAAVSEENFRPGQAIVEAGEPGGRMFVIASGQAEVRIGDAARRQLGPGSLIGELSVFDHSPRTATVVAGTDVKAIALSSTEFQAVLDEQPSIARAVILTLVSRLRALEKDLL